MSYVIAPTAEVHFAGLHQALDVIARERRFLAIFETPPFSDSVTFYRRVIANDFCQFVALDQDSVVGWCDILPSHGQARAHVGVLGIGVVPNARGKGLGRRLMAETISKARSKGFTRIELSVRTDNAPAKALYESFGFCVEGLHHCAHLVDGKYIDGCSMALLL